MSFWKPLNKSQSRHAGESRHPGGPLKLLDSGLRRNDKEGVGASGYYFYPIFKKGFRYEKNSN